MDYQQVVKIIKMIFCIPLLFLTLGCSSPKEIIREVPVEVVRTEYKNIFIHDSIHEHDSIFMTVKGDTVTKEIYKYKYIQNTAHDTLVTHDTVPKVVTVTQIVEKKVPQWWPVYLTIGLLIVAAICYLWFKFKK